MRRERAAATRAAVVESAARSFSELGWAGTTLGRIAASAGVSVDTVRLVGSKAFLLLEAFRARYAGVGGWESLLEQPDVRQILEIADRDAGIAAAADFLTTGHARSARLWLVVRTTAATDVRVAEEFARLSVRKEESFQLTTQWLGRIGVVPAAADRALVARVNLVMSAESYLLLTEDYGLDDAGYHAWVVRRLQEGIR